MTKSIDSELVPLNISLAGKVVTAVDAANIGLANFRSLINLRPGPTNPEPIQGMTKINTAALANVNITKGIQFRKDDPTAESHVIVHAKDANNANGKVYRNTAVVPAQGAFTSTALFSDSAGAGTPRFSLTPLGGVAYCNGTDSVVWLGLEATCLGYIDYNPDQSYRYNYLRQITNDLTDADNLATVHRYSETVDANTEALFHFDGVDEGTTFMDSSGNAHDATGVGNANTETSDYKFGTASCELDGTGDYLTVADHANFNFSATGTDGNFTIEFWIIGKANSVTGVPGGTWWSHATAAGTGDYMRIGIAGLSIYAAGSEVVALEWPPNTFLVSAESLAAWRHIVVVGKKTGSTYDYRLFLNGTLKASLIGDAQCPADYNRPICIGAWDNGTTIADVVTACKMDEVRISSTYRWISAFEPPTRAYGSGNLSNFYIASPLPLQGINWYVQTANTTAGTAVVYYWNGYAWVTVGTLTGVGATPFSTTGKNSWTFTSTASTAKQRVIDGGMAYWYKVEITETDTTTQFYKITLDCAMQQIQDIWDGSYREIASFQKYSSSTYNDLTVNVFKDEWDSSNTATFAELDSLATATDKLYFGFTERLTAIRLSLIGAHVNTTAGTVMMIEYYNGTAWTSVGTIDDGTMEGGISLAKSGLVSWNAPTLANEFETNLPGISKGRPQLYYYRLSFSQNLSADVQLFYVGGLPVQRELKGYEFPFQHLNRLWLAKGNMIVSSSQDTAQVFNGDDSLEFPIGDSSDVVGAASLTTRVGNSIYAVLLLYKKGELWALIGSDPENMMGPLKIADVGLTAVDTLAVIPSYEVGPGISRPIAVWQASDGIYMSDGFSVNPIHGDIADRFDDRKSTCINRTYVSSSFGAYDERFNEYHWSYAEGSATAPDQEWVYRFTGGKWFEIDRTAAKRLKALIPVKDTSGNSYMYGAIQGGYMERLENGPTFDTVNITYTMWPADIAPGTPQQPGDLAVETKVRGIKLTMKANNDTANTVSITHYVDGDTTGKAVTAMAPQKTGRRITQVYRSVDHDGVLHSTSFVLSSDLGTVGFEPLFLSYYFKPVRLDKGFSTGTPVS